MVSIPKSYRCLVKKYLIIKAKNTKKILGETELVVSIEASETNYWKKYTGTNGLNFGINDFGKSAHIKKFMIILN